MQKINKSFKVANHQQFHILKQYETPLQLMSQIKQNKSVNLL